MKKMVMGIDKLKFIMMLGFLLSSHIIGAQENKELEENGPIFIVGLGPTLEMSESLYGINGRFYYGINETFCFGPEIAFFPYQKVGEEYETNIVDLNLNAHYILELTDKLGVYPLSGINYTIEKERLEDHPEDSETVSEFGFNYGVGAHYKIGDIFVLSEFKGILGDLSAEFLTIGVITEF